MLLNKIIEGVIPDLVSKRYVWTTNLLLTEREGRIGEYWPEVVAVGAERSEVRTKTTEDQYSPVRSKQARLVSSLLYGTQTMLVLNFPDKKNPEQERTNRNAIK